MAVKVAGAIADYVLALHEPGQPLVGGILECLPLPCVASR